MSETLTLRAPKLEVPSKLTVVREAATPLNWLSLLWRAPKLLSVPTGDNRAIMFAPGYMATELSMRPLASYMHFIGYRSFQWGLGRNKGQVDAHIDSMGEQVVELSSRLGEAVTLIGWSLGGVISREVARLYPEYVREVITLGTPIIGGPKYTTVGHTFAKRNQLDLEAFEQHVHERNSIGIQQPVTSIYSKSDGIVDWQASIDIYNSQARNIEVKCTHLGMVASAEVWVLLAHLLSGRSAL